MCNTCDATLLRCLELRKHIRRDVSPPFEFDCVRKRRLIILHRCLIGLRCDDCGAGAYDPHPQASHRRLWAACYCFARAMRCARARACPGVQRIHADRRAALVVAQVSRAKTPHGSSLVSSCQRAQVTPCNASPLSRSPHGPGVFWHDF